MKILLIGEYSGLHNSLKDGLQLNGHSVTLLGTGDGFKNYPVDIEVKSTIFEIPFLKFIAKIIDKLLKVSLNDFELGFKAYLKIKTLKDFDIVQLINENSFKTTPWLETILLKKILKNNKNLFLLSCGVDYISVKYALENKFKYSILTPYLNDKLLLKKYRHILKYNSSEFKKLHRYIYKNIKGVISSDLDYHIPLIGEKKYLGMVPNPVNLKKLSYDFVEIEDKVIIFHGINSKNSTKKGNDYFIRAMEIIKKKYKESVEYIEVQDLKYRDYMKSYCNCHIFLDQVYAYDQGYNALEAMAKGKVVFTGAEKEWLEHYGVSEDGIAINALPDVNYLVEKLSILIENPKKIKDISINARKFIEDHHNYDNVANIYESKWLKAINYEK
ncbi:MAG: glycosyltransferase family 1 protein [Flavobacteriales bacterium]|nr:MAG: glycosyltransferase family 1 protein [Flavobacteriales bacterium]